MPIHMALHDSVTMLPGLQDLSASAPGIHALYINNLTQTLSSLTSPAYVVNHLDYLLMKH